MIRVSAEALLFTKVPASVYKIGREIDTKNFEISHESKNHWIQGQGYLVLIV